MLKQIVHLCALIFEIIPLSKIIFATLCKFEMRFAPPKKVFFEKESY